MLLFSATHLLTASAPNVSNCTVKVSDENMYDENGFFRENVKFQQ